MLRLFKNPRKVMVQVTRDLYMPSFFFCCCLQNSCNSHVSLLSPSTLLFHVSIVRSIMYYSPYSLPWWDPNRFIMLQRSHTTVPGIIVPSCRWSVESKIKRRSKDSDFFLSAVAYRSYRHVSFSLVWQLSIGLLLSH